MRQHEHRPLCEAGRVARNTLRCTQAGRSNQRFRYATQKRRLMANIRKNTSNAPAKSPSASLLKAHDLPSLSLKTTRAAALRVTESLRDTKGKPQPRTERDRST